MGAAITLGNVVGETQHTLVVAIIPLHGNFYTDMRAWNAAIGFRRTLTLGVKSIRVQNFFACIDELHKTCHTASTRIIIILTSAFIHQTDAYAIVQIAQLTQTFAKNLIMEIMVLREDVGIG